MSIPYEVQLFIGFPLDQNLQSHIERLPSEVKSLFISAKNPSYLEEITFENTLYLGKRIGSICDVSQARLYQAHIESLVTKFLPEVSIYDTIRIIPLGEISV